MEGSGGLRRKDTTKGPPLRILSLDGGGVRGYSMLIIIQELMHRTYVELEGKAPRRDQIPKPCDHFDLICGTGTGGLIAIMLGRLRLDLETCKEVYIRMTRKVFETDKTFAGIPYRSTLFKASKLEEAIQECVREHTVYEDEGNDSPDALPSTSAKSTGKSDNPRRHLSNASVVSFSARSPTSITRPSQFTSAKWGNSNALLYDARENRTKTAVTAIFKGTTKGGHATFLRSYDSRAEPAPEVNCTIWQAGRATSAIGLAFKPIQIGQSVFIDEGAGRYNCSDLVLDEATVNEWPGREVGVFVSVGNGKRPAGTDGNQHLWYEGFLGEFAEARKRLISKIEGCEVTHQHMLKEQLSKRGVNVENYYRFNVEVGVGEFGMNEWNRLADISTGTRRYLGKSEIQQMNLSAAAKLGKIALAKNRNDARMRLDNVAETTWQRPMENPLAVELPAEVPESAIHTPPPRISYESGHSDQLAVPVARPMSLQEPLSSQYSPRSSGEKLSPVQETSNGNRSHGNHGNHPNSSPRPNSNPGPNTHPNLNSRHNSNPNPNTRPSNNPRRAHDDSFITSAPTPSQYATAGGADKIAIVSLDEFPRPQEPPVRRPQQMPTGPPPPIPPKTPIPGERQNHSYQPRMRMSAPVSPLPYPDDDEPPPVVNKLRKPDYRGR